MMCVYTVVRLKHICKHSEFQSTLRNTLLSLMLSLITDNRFLNRTQKHLVSRLQTGHCFVAYIKIQTVHSLQASSHNAFAAIKIDMASDALIETDFVLLMSQMSFPRWKFPKE